MVIGRSDGTRYEDEAEAAIADFEVAGRDLDKRIPPPLPVLPRGETPSIIPPPWPVPPQVPPRKQTMTDETPDEIKAGQRSASMKQPFFPPMGPIPTSDAIPTRPHLPTLEEAQAEGREALINLAKPSDMPTDTRSDVPHLDYQPPVVGYPMGGMLDKRPYDPERYPDQKPKRDSSYPLEPGLQLISMKPPFLPSSLDDQLTEFAGGSGARGGGVVSGPGRLFGEARRASRLSEEALYNEMRDIQKRWREPGFWDNRTSEQKNAILTRVESLTKEAKKRQAQEQVLKAEERQAVTETVAKEIAQAGRKVEEKMKREIRKLKLEPDSFKTGEEGVLKILQANTEKFKAELGQRLNKLFATEVTTGHKRVNPEDWKNVIDFLDKIKPPGPQSMTDETPDPVKPGQQFASMQSPFTPPTLDTLLTEYAGGSGARGSAPAASSSPLKLKYVEGRGLSGRTLPPEVRAFTFEAAGKPGYIIVQPRTVYKFDEGSKNPRQVKDLYIQEMGTKGYTGYNLGSAGQWTMGPAVIKDVLRELKKEFPEAKTFTAQRVSGARRKHKDNTGEFGRTMITREFTDWLNKE